MKQEINKYLEAKQEYSDMTSKGTDYLSYPIGELQSKKEMLVFFKEQAIRAIGIHYFKDAVEKVKDNM